MTEKLKERFLAWITWAVLITASLCFLHRPALATGVPEPDWFNYQITFPPDPTDGVAALATRSMRAIAVLRFVACGRELSFLNYVQAESDPSNDAGNGEDLSTTIIGKMSWLIQSQGDDCETQVNLRRDSISADQWADLSRIPDPETNPNPPGDETNKKMAAAYGPDCAQPIIKSVTVGSDQPPVAHLHFLVTAKCLRAQINKALQNMQQSDKQLGSSGLPCNGGPGTTKGEWDVTVRDLIRILYLNRAQDVGGPLDQATIDHVQNDLITVDSSLGQASYSWLQCGDTENSTGSPEDRADENSWIQEAVGSIGDVLKWLLRRFLIILIIFTVAGLIGALVASLTSLGAGVAAAAIVAIVGVYAAFTIRITQSENHRFNIESSRFLNNQLVLAAASSSDLSSDQAEVKTFLLGQMQKVLSSDLEEYNARPYQRYSLESSMNLADFSQDQDVRLGAQMALEYAFAKFALGSNQGRRVVPFRRLMKEVNASWIPASARRERQPRRGRWKNSTLVAAVTIQRH